jgi:hypothetical protein
VAIPDLDAYKLALQNTRQVAPVNVGATTTRAGLLYDLWRTTVPLGAVPTAAVAPDRTLLGALGQHNPGGSQALGILAARFSALNPGQYIIADRLSHTGGLSGTVTTAQTTNLPTAALTRYTSGEGVWAALSIYGTLGTTATTVSASYTNQAGTSGRTSPLRLFGGTGSRETHRCIVLPLQDTDTGVRAVASVTVTTTTGTAGVFGVTLFRPLFVICVPDTSGVLSAGGFIAGSTFGGVAEIEDDACLFPLAVMAGASAFGSGALLLEGH